MAAIALLYYLHTQVPSYRIGRMHELSFFMVGGGKKTNFSVDAKVNGRPFPLFRNPRRVAIPFTFCRVFRAFTGLKELPCKIPWGYRR